MAWDCPECGDRLDALTGDLTQPARYRCQRCKINFRHIGIMIREREEGDQAPGSLTESKLPEPGPKPFDPGQYK